MINLTISTDDPVTISILKELQKKQDETLSTDSCSLVVEGRVVVRSMSFMFTTERTDENGKTIYLEKLIDCVP